MTHFSGTSSPMCISRVIEDDGVSPQIAANEELLSILFVSHGMDSRLHSDGHGTYGNNL